MPRQGQAANPPVAMLHRPRLTEKQKAHLLRGLLERTLGHERRPTIVAIRECLYELASELAHFFGMGEADARAKAFHYYNNQFSKSSRSIGKFLRVPFDENATQEDILHAARVCCGWKDWELDCLQSSAWFQGRPWVLNHGPAVDPVPPPPLLETWADAFFDEGNLP